MTHTTWRISALAALLFLLPTCGSGEQSGPETCNRNSDCADPLASCQGNTCQRECGDDRDCPEATFCEEGQCITGAVSCRSDDDCFFNQDCIQGVCAEIEGFCERNRDCDEGQGCSSRTNTCIDTGPPGGDCDSAADCFVDEVCVRGRCTLNPDSECSRASDCDADEICIDGSCEPECLVDRDCGRGEVCEDGRCEAGDDPNPDPNPSPNPDPEPEPGSCGDGVCQGGESRQNCPQDCNCQQNAGLCQPSEECCDGLCVERGACPSDFWQVCEGASDCSDELCLGDPRTMIGHCTQRCGARSQCPQQPVSALCINGNNIITQQPGGQALVGLCFEDDTGTACNPQAANNCFDGVCIDRRPNGAVEGQCSIRCTTAAECSPGYACGPKEFQVMGQPQLINVCVPIGRQCQGVDIEAANQCYSGICVTGDNNVGLCTTLCSSGAQCPTGSTCSPVDPQNSVCIPQ